MNFLNQALLILALPLVVWWPLRRVMPLVLSQILCGIAIGPSVLGHLAPTAFAQIFPSGTLGALGGISSLAVVCVGFIAGMELDIDELRHQARHVVRTGLASFAIPALGGAAFAGWALTQWPALAGAHATQGAFIAAGAICFGVTALPVLVAILRELDLLGTAMGRVALSLAAINDMLLWVGLAGLMLVISHKTQTLGNWWWGLLLLLLALVTTLFAIRPKVSAWLADLDAGKELSTARFTLVLIGLLACAIITDTLGLHAVIGAFVAGVLMPKALRPRITQLAGPFSNALLLPFFFVSAGLSLDITAGPVWPFFIASVVIGSALKIISTAVPARAWGWRWPQALQLGALMQSRGLMEIIVLRVLYDAGVISQSCLSALMLMALVCTGLAMPLARWLDRQSAAPATAATIANLPAAR